MSYLPYKVTALARSDNGDLNIIPGATVTVLNSTGGYATLREADFTTPIPNPFNCDENGERQIYLQGGSYTFSVDGGQSWEIRLSGASDIQSVETIADLRNLTGLTNGQSIYVRGYLGSLRGGGMFTASDNVVDADNGVTRFVTTDGVRVYRDYKGYLTPHDAGATGDGATDDSIAWQRLVNNASLIVCDNSTFVIDSVSVSRSITIRCAGTTFLRKSGADLASGSYWLDGAAMFEPAANGIVVVVEGDFTYDGNNANQTTTEPTGFFLKLRPPAVIGRQPISARVSGGKFINGTSGYLLLRGDDVNKRYETYVVIDNCKFYDTVYGKGKGDPSTPNPLGYNPTYVLVLDYVRVVTNNFHAQFDATTGTGQYAATALNGTFFGSVYANSGESHIWMSGTTYVKNCGRSAKKWDDDNEWVTNNGIGAIDMYGNADTLYIENLIADNCQNVPARAKGSLKNYTVLNAVLTNCHRGLQVGPSTTGTCETRVYVGTVKAYGGTIPQVEFVGTNTGDVLPSVKIDDAYVSGPLTNPESLLSYGAVHIRNVGKFTSESIGVFGAPIRGVHIQDYGRAHLSNTVVNTTSTGNGIFVGAGTLCVLDGFDVINAGAEAISIATNPETVSVRNGKILNAVNYGVFSNTTTTHLTVENVVVDTVTGTGRSFYAGGGDVAFIRNKSTGAATPLFVPAGTNKREDHNSWNAVIQYASAAPVSGTWKAGDITYNAAPSASGTVGWVCTTAGTPGTWKEFGAIAS